MSGVSRKGLRGIERQMVLNDKHTSWLEGGEITLNADDSKFDLSAGCGYITDNYTDINQPTTYKVEWPAFTAVDHNPGTFATAIAIEINQITGKHNATGQIILFDNQNAFTAQQNRDYVVLGAIVHLNLVNITLISNRLRISAIDGQISAVEHARRVGFFLTGFSITANGANLKLNQSAYSSFQIGSNVFFDAKSPDTISNIARTPMVWAYLWRDGAGGYVVGSSDTIEDLETNNFDDNTGGLSSNNKPDGVLGNNNFTIDRVYVYPGTNTSVVHFGQNEYNTFTGAFDAKETEIFDNSPLTSKQNGANHVYWIIRKKGILDLAAAIIAGDAALVKVPE
jgi:hypothetical protein